jgi:hypothetical protein
MPKHIYIAVDPNGGGMSKMGVVAGYTEGNDTVVSSLHFPPLVCVCMCVCQPGYRVTHLVKKWRASPSTL